MAMNTIILIVVATVAALVLVGVVATVTRRTRNQHRHVIDETIQDKAKQDALHIRHQEALADEYAAKAHAAQVEVDVKTARATRLIREAAVQRREAVSCREELTP
jgi:uncharacterized protein (DUF488 family)